MLQDSTALYRPLWEHNQRRTAASIVHQSGLEVRPWDNHEVLLGEQCSLEHLERLPVLLMKGSKSQVQNLCIIY